MSDNKLALILFYIGFAAMLVSMVTGPFGITDLSLIGGAAACIFALASLYLAFQNFDAVPHAEPGGGAKHKADTGPAGRPPSI